MKKLINKLFDKVFIKFILVGIVNTLVGTGVMFAAYNIIHMGYWFSSAANYVVGSVVSYFLNKYFTFNNTQKSWKQVITFIINITVCYLLAYGLAKPLVRCALRGQGIKVQDNVSMLVGMGLFVILNYLGQRLLVFKNDEDVQ